MKIQDPGPAYSQAPPWHQAFICKDGIPTTCVRRSSGRMNNGKLRACSPTSIIQLMRVRARARRALLEERNEQIHALPGLAMPRDAARFAEVKWPAPPHTHYSAMMVRDRTDHLHYIQEIRRSIRGRNFYYTWHVRTTSRKNTTPARPGTYISTGVGT